MEVNSLNHIHSHIKESGVVVVKDHLFVVLTSFDKKDNVIHKPSDSAFIINLLKEDLLYAYEKGKLKPNHFNQYLLDTSSRLLKKYQRGHKDIKNHQIPYISMAICYVNGQNVHLYNIGNNAIFIQKQDKKSVFLHDRSLTLVKNKGIDIFSKKRNNLFTLKNKGNFKYSSSSFDINDLKSAHLVSDSYYSAYDELHLYKSRKSLFKQNVDLQDVNKKVKDKIDRDVVAIRITF